MNGHLRGWYVSGGIAYCLAVGLLAGSGNLAIAAMIGMLPMLVIIGDAFLASNGVAVIIFAMVMNLTELSLARLPLFSHPFHLYLPDILVVLVFLHWALGKRPAGLVRQPPPAAFLLAAAVFCATVLIGTVEGYTAYSTPLISNSSRLVIYAIFAVAVTRYTPAQLERGLRIGFYLGVVVTAVLGTYYLATGTSQTNQAVVTTGGDRTIALSTSMFVAGGMILALLSIARSRSFSEARLDWAILTLGIYEQILALSRTTLIALVILVPAILLSSREARRRVLVVALILGAVILSVVLVANPSTPAPIASFERRIFDTNSQDRDVLWRAQAAHAMLSGLDSHLLTGVGFGRSPYFTLRGLNEQVKGGDPHDGFIYLLSGGGLLALASFVSMILLSFRILARRITTASAGDRLVLWWSGAFLFVYLVNVATLPVISIVFYMPTLWILLGIPFTSRLPASNRPTDASGDAPTKLKKAPAVPALAATH